MDMKQLMDMANQLRTQLTDAQESAGDVRHTGEAGGGMVRIALNGRHEVIEVKIDKAAVDLEDLSLLEDLIRAAFNQASAQLAAGLQNRLGSVAQNLGVDLSAFNLGGEGGDDDKGGKDGT